MTAMLEIAISINALFFKDRIQNDRLQYHRTRITYFDLIPIAYYTCLACFWYERHLRRLIITSTPSKALLNVHFLRNYGNCC